MSGSTGDGRPMPSGIRQRGGVLAAATLAVLVMTSAATRAADIETRDFFVFVSGKRSGDDVAAIHTHGVSPFGRRR